ncbi:MAG TPA: hypothetical protein ENK26_02335 [Gammaproteobacteria bacterium]|nr:hypothetical protein [Gammaproteobacteria bacterium]
MLFYTEFSDKLRIMSASTQRLPQPLQLLYAELLQQCAMALPSQRGVSFVAKTVNGGRYWYMEVVVGSGKKQYSLGRDTPTLRDLIERQKKLFAQARPEEKNRQQLVSMLVSGGLPAPGSAEGRVLELLAQSGVFLSGGVLVGSHAFGAYQGMLGVSWAKELTRTQDIDLASETSIDVAIPSDAPDIKSVLLESGMGFFAIPALNRKSPSTAFKVQGRNLHVDLLTPLRGPNRQEPVPLTHFKSYAHPVRFLDYLLEEAQMAVLPFRSGVLVNTPAPARYALHKLVVMERRPAAQHTKAIKDKMQAELLLEILLDERPGDVWAALDAAGRMPRKFRATLEEGLEKLAPALRERLS